MGIEKLRNLVIGKLKTDTEQMKTITQLLNFPITQLIPALRRDWAVALRTPIAKELPDFANFGDHLEVEVRYHDFVFVAARLRNNFAARVAKITLAVKFPDAPRFLGTYAVDCAHKITVGDGVRRLFQFP